MFPCCRIRLGVFAFIAIAAACLVAPVASAATSTPDAIASSTTVIAESEATTTPATAPPALGSREGGSYERAIVRNVTQTPDERPDGGEQKIRYAVEYLSGPLKGKTSVIVSDISTNPYGLEPRIGDRVVVYLQTTQEGDPVASLEGFDRRNALAWILFAFVAAFCLLGGWQGFKVAASAVASVAIIGWILVPTFMGGTNPIPVAIALVVALTGFMTTLTVGWNRKMLATTIGVLGGATASYLLASAFAGMAHLQGFASEGVRTVFEQNPLLDPANLLVAGVIVAAAGVIQDLSASIACGVVDSHGTNPRRDMKGLFLTGMVIGREHIRTLAPALVFASLGAVLSGLLLVNAYEGSWLKLLNDDIVAEQIVRSLAGTIGLVCTVPIAALAAAIACLNINRPLDPVRRAAGWRQRDVERGS
jgi:uncharacterized membrane protein